MKKDNKILPIEDQIEILKEAILSVTVAQEQEAYEVVHYLNRSGLQIEYR